MNIGVVVDNELNNDVRVLREIRILKDQGFNISVLCFSFGKEYPEAVSGVTISRISLLKKIKNILFFFQNTIPVYEWLWSHRIKEHILKYKIDVLHVHDLYMSRAVNSGIKSSGRNIPMVLDLHENYAFTVATYNWTKGLLRRFFSRPEAWKNKEHEYLKYASRIIVLSKEFSDLLCDRYHDLKSDIFTVLPNVPDIKAWESNKKFKVANPFSNNFPIIFYYGIIAERRGIFDALRVFTDLVRENHSVNFLLIGPVDKMDKPLFVRMIGEEILSGRIHWIPWIESAEFASYLEICDICIAPFHKNPQHESGVANKVYEYMLGGKPVIASDCEPQQNLLEDHKCGLIFRDGKEFHNEIITLINDEDLRLTMGNNGKHAILNSFNTKTVKSQLIALYDQLSSSM